MGTVVVGAVEDVTGRDSLKPFFSGGILEGLEDFLVGCEGWGSVGVADSAVKLGMASLGTMEGTPLDFFSVAVVVFVAVVVTCL